MNHSRARILQCLLVAFCLPFLSSLSAQQVISTTAREGQAYPNWITLSKGVVPGQLAHVLQAELDWPTVYGLVPKGTPVEDQLGQQHRRFQQTCKGIPVFGATVAAHGSGGLVNSMNGELVSAKVGGPQGSVLGHEAALDMAKRIVRAETYMWESPRMETFIKAEQQDPQATFRPTPKLVYYPLSFPNLTGELRLAYLMDVYAKKPRSRQFVIVDAYTGKLLNTIERLHAIDEPGTAMTAYSGEQPIITFRPSTSAPFDLRDLTRGGGIITYDCLNTADYDAAQVPTSTTNNWDLGSLAANSILDAHWGTEQTYDFYLNEHNWDSFDNEGSPMLSYVHFSLIDFGYPSNNNAFWDGERMTYGDGDGVNYNPLTAIDVLGHEITHGVTENSAGLVYEYESGALNESFSDIMGACIEFYAKPNGFSWFLGNDMSVDGSPMRDMSDPNQRGDPDTYQGDFWHTDDSDNGGVHTNSGVQNFWFYLLSEGGTGTNDNDDVYSVQGIGIESAGDIVFRSLTMYLNANSEYDDARAGSIQAATDLFGGCSAELAAVTNAWYAVGVGTPFNNAVLAAFTGSSHYYCTAPAPIQFTNGSLNADGYLWDFGDGTTSTEVNPLHTYAAPGSYTVTLVASGSTPCNTGDTLIAPQAIVVATDGSLAAALCQPADPGATTDAGIFSFSFAGMAKESTGAPAGYQDFSCEAVTDLTEGMPYPLNVELHLPGYLGAWIDLDNDGDFSPGELVYNSNGESMVHAAEVIVPAGTVFNDRVRMRVVSSSQPITTACLVAGGQAEDYSVRIMDNTAPPIADFMAEPITVLVGTSTTLQDLSLNAPTQWNWTFEGGDITTSTLQHPVVAYATVGDYDVQLIASNSHGADTLMLADYIHVVNAFNLCQVENTTAPAGTFFDPGGPASDYGDNQTCTLLIEPACAVNITVSFLAFNVENTWDYLRFYDGNNENAPLLGAFTGNSLPADITSTGGVLYVEWMADQSVNYSGFEVSWTSQMGSSDPPEAVASADNLSPAYGQAVQFTDLSLNLPTAWFWDFGDGTTSQEQNPVHVYASAGPKTVVFTASNCNGPDMDTLYIDVQESGTIAAVPNAIALLGNPCMDSLYASFTVINTGVGLLNWNLMSTLADDFEGASFNSDLWMNSEGVNSSGCGAALGSRAHRFSGNGLREIVSWPLPITAYSHFSFYLRYGTGGSCEEVEEGEYVVLEYSLNGTDWTLVEAFPNLDDYADWALVDVDLPPAAASSQTRLRLRQVDYDGMTFDVWAIDEVRITIGYLGDLTIAPTAGSTTAGDSTVVTVAITGDQMPPGTYQDTLQVYSNDPSQTMVQVPVTITIADLPCAAFSLNYADTCMGLVQFTNTTVNDAGVWHWDFGDGTTSNEQSPAHVYTAAGDYTVTLTAGSAPLSTQYVVEVHANPMVAALSHSDPNANNGTVEFNANSPTAIQWSWAFGDGATSTEESPTHTYMAVDDYMVVLVVWDDAGCMVTLTDVIHYGTIGIEEVTANGITVMPNPSNGHFTIRMDGISGTAKAWIMDAIGRTAPGTWMLHNGDNAIDISGLADGAYVLRVEVGDAVRFVRIAKQ